MTDQLPTDEEAMAMALDTPLPVFVFGTLRPGNGNARLWQHTGHAKHDDEAVIANHRLVSNGYFPYCIPSEGDTTTGTLIYPNDPTHTWRRMINDMDILEGVPVHYTRQMIGVHTPDGEVTAWYYIPTDWHTYNGYEPVPFNNWTHRVRRSYR